MPMGRPLPPLSIGQEQRKQLVSWSRRPKTAQALAMRARIVLLAAEGLSNTAIAQQVSTTLQTVGKWRRRFREGGIDSLPAR
jgi:DNA-binding NarL/FixJ family response regulator